MCPRQAANHHNLTTTQYVFIPRQAGEAGELYSKVLCGLGPGYSQTADYKSTIQQIIQRMALFSSGTHTIGLHHNPLHSSKTNILHLLLSFETRLIKSIILEV